MNREQITLLISESIRLQLKVLLELWGGKEDTMGLGHDRVRGGFNPSGDDKVEQIKAKTAELIDLCEELKPLDGRLVALAQTAYEEAAMWAVKAATTKK